MTETDCLKADMQAPAGSRMSARAEIDRVIQMTERRLTELKALRDSIWWDKLTPEADSCLWGILLNYR